MHILHIDDDPLMRDLVALLIHKAFGIQVRQASSGFEAIAKLKLGEEYDLIISDYNMPNGNGGDVYRYLHTKQIHVPFILMSSDHPSQHEEFSEHQLDGYIIKPNIQTPLKNLLGQILHLHENTKEFLSDKFVEVHAKTLLTIGELPFDIFLKIGQNKHVRILKKGSIFSQSLQERYQSKDVDHFLIKSIDSDVLLVYLANSLEILAELKNSQNILDDIHKIMDSIQDTDLKQQLIKVTEAIEKLETSPLATSEALVVSEATQRAAQRALKKLGASLEVQTLIKASVQLTLNTLDKIPELQGPLRRLFNQKENYLSSHALILAQVSCLLATRMGWSSNLTRYKLGLASFLHDITLSNHDLAKIDSLKELEDKRANFTNSEIHDFKNHPQTSAAYIKDFQQIPPDVHVIIEQHHELPDGTGFPIGMSPQKIAPLAALFIIAHDLTAYMMEQSSHINVIEKFIQLRQKKYSHGAFKKIIQSLVVSTDQTELSLKARKSPFKPAA